MWEGERLKETLISMDFVLKVMESHCLLCRLVQRRKRDIAGKQVLLARVVATRTVAIF